MDIRPQPVIKCYGENFIQKKTDKYCNKFSLIYSLNFLICFSDKIIYKESQVSTPPDTQVVFLIKIELKFCAQMIHTSSLTVEDDNLHPKSAYNTEIRLEGYLNH